MFSPVLKSLCKADKGVIMFKKISILAGFIISITLLQGCMMPNKPYKAEKVKADKSLIYIYRPSSIISRGTHFNVLVNKKQKLTPLIDNAYVYTYVAPGSVNLVLQENTIFNGKLHEVNFDVKAGMAYYIKAEPALFGAYELEMKDEKIGEKEIKKAKFFIPKK